MSRLKLQADEPQAQSDIGIIPAEVQICNDTVAMSSGILGDFEMIIISSTNWRGAAIFCDCEMENSSIDEFLGNLVFKINILILISGVQKLSAMEYEVAEDLHK